LFLLLCTRLLIEKRLVPNIILSAPIRKSPRLTDQIKNQITKYFGLVYRGFTAAQLKAQIDWDTLVRYGCFRLAGDGDSIRTADTIQHDPTARDNSFVRVCFLHTYLFLSCVTDRPLLSVRSLARRELLLQKPARRASLSDALRTGARHILCRVHRGPTVIIYNV
jgi:hypothetical protein